jgi:hypothetical protein
MPNKKPPGYKAFNDLAKVLIQVPKKELDSQVSRYEAKKKKRRTKPKKSK